MGGKEEEFLKSEVRDVQIPFGGRNFMRLQLYFPLQKPYFITQFFGPSQLPIYKQLGMLGHNGLDCASPRGKPVLASHDGQVVYAGQDGNEGYGVVIRTLTTFEYNGQEMFFKTLYWHLLANIPVRVGQRVRIGDIVGYADSTGLSTGDHLHFGLKPQYQGANEWTWFNAEQNNGYFGGIDPEPYLIKDKRFSNRNTDYMSSYEIKTGLQMLAEDIERLARSISNYLRRIKK